MRQTTYLNVILTLNAVLLSGLLWTQVARTPLLAQSAEAQATTGANGGLPGIPNAGSQRDQMIRHLDRLNRNLELTMKLVESGKTRVEVTNLKDIKIEQPANQD